MHVSCPPTLTPSIAEMTPVTDPRTGEAQLLHDFSRGTRADSAFSKFWSFGIKGFAPAEVPAASMYSANGSPGAAADARGQGLVGASTDVLRYKPEYLKKLLEREPWRRAAAHCCQDLIRWHHRSAGYSGTEL